MKKLLYLLPITFLLNGCSIRIVSSNTNKDYQLYKPDYSQVTQTTLSSDYKQTIFDFANTTVSYVFEEEENSIYSPTSYLLALSMLSEIATNELLEELLTTLNFASTQEIQQFANNLFTSSFINGDSKLHLATSTWTNDVFTPNTQMINNLVDYYYSTYYHGDLHSAEASEMLDNWLKEVTYDLIDLESFSTNPLQLSDVLMVLFSSIYASSNWDGYMQESNKPFYTYNTPSNEVPVINATSYDLYAKNDKYESFNIPMLDDFSFLIVLPEENLKVNDILLDNSLLKQALDLTNYTYQKVSHTIPKFEIESEIDLLDISAKIGLSHIQNSGQLNNLVEGNYDIRQVIASIKQNGKIIVDEKGVKAAAVTSIGMIPESCGEGCSSTPKIFNADRPFIYALMYKNIPHFIGTVYNP